MCYPWYSAFIDEAGERLVTVNDGLCGHSEISPITHDAGMDLRLDMARQIRLPFSIEYKWLNHKYDIDMDFAHSTFGVTKDTIIKGSDPEDIVEGIKILRLAFRHFLDRFENVGKFIGWLDAPINQEKHWKYLDGTEKIVKESTVPRVVLDHDTRPHYPETCRPNGMTALDDIHVAYTGYRDDLAHDSDDLWAYCKEQMSKNGIYDEKVEKAYGKGGMRIKFEELCGVKL